MKNIFLLIFISAFVPSFSQTDSLKKIEVYGEGFEFKCSGFLMDIFELKKVSIDDNSYELISDTILLRHLDSCRIKYIAQTKSKEKYKQVKMVINYIYPNSAKCFYLSSPPCFLTTNGNDFKLKYDTNYIKELHKAISNEKLKNYLNSIDYYCKKVKQ